MLDDVWQFRSSRQASLWLSLQFNLDRPLMLWAGVEAKKIMRVPNIQPDQPSRLHCNILQSLGVFHCALANEHLFDWLV